MTAVWEPRFAELVRRLANLRESTQLELLPDLMPVVPVVSADDVEHQWARGDYPLMGGVRQVGGAAQYASFLLWNPPGSGKLVFVDELQAAAEGAGWMVFGTQLNPYSVSPAGGGWGAVGSLTGLDSRPMDMSGGTPTLTVASLWSQAWGSTIATGTFSHSPNGPPTRAPARWVVAPGWGLNCSARTANTACHFSVKWRERVTGPGHAESMGARP